MAKSVEDKIKTIIHQHIRYVEGWQKPNPLSIMWRSPRGKLCTSVEKDTAILNHLDQSAKKIMQLKGA